MAIDLKPGQTVRVTISKNITREGARKTLIRLFMKDKAVASAIGMRARPQKKVTAMPVPTTPRMICSRIASRDGRGARDSQ